MKTYSCLLVAAAMFAGGCQTTPQNPNPAKATDITVNFQDQDKFTDVRETANGGTSQFYLDVLGKFLKETAAARLTAGEKLSVTFTDIDLAGDIRPGQINDIRIVKDIYRPRMTLHFQLTDTSGAVVKEGDRTISDLSFMQNINPIGQNEALRYDKALIADWIRKEFTP